MYERGLTAKQLIELEAAGLTPDDFATGPIDIWPDNLLAFELFLSLRTQWRSGMAGAIGLDYNVMYHKMGRMNLASEDYDQLERDIAVMESAALAAMSKSPDE